MTSPRCVILGGGGHAKVLVDAIRASSAAKIHGVLDRHPKQPALLGYSVLGDDLLLPKMRSEGVTHFAVGVGAVGDPGPRMRLFEQGRAASLEPLTVVHPSAVVSPNARVLEGAQVFAAAVVNPDAVVGRNAIVNTGAIVEHDVVLGDHAHVATGAKVAGNVTIGEGAFVGAGATIRQGIRVGARALVAAGAVVVRDVAPSAVVMGVPAEVKS